jgi:hypothetical protein
VRERLPLVLALAVVLALGSVVALRRGGLSRAPAGGAEQTLRLALSAAADGDAKGYLACFAAPLQKELRAAVAEAGPAAFGAALRRRSDGMTGWAVSRRLAGDATGDSVTLRVEAVFENRSESQDYELRRDGGRWRIAALGPAQVTRMPIAYGTPVGAESAAADGTGGSAPQETGPPAAGPWNAASPYAACRDAEIPASTAAGHGTPETRRVSQETR